MGTVQVPRIMSRPDSFPLFQDYVGEGIANLLLYFTRQGKLDEDNALDLAEYLDKTLKKEDQTVSGNIRNARKTNGYKYGERVMKILLSDWFGIYESYGEITSKETIETLVNGLKKIGMK